MTDRQSAKSGIQTTDQSEPELDTVLSEGHKLQLAVLRERNRHKELMQKNELGWIGQFVGGESTASITLASAVVGLGIIGVIAGIALTAVNPGLKDFWGKEIGISFGAISSAMSFVFGKTSKK